MTKTSRILFVDDEPSVLAGLQRLLRSARREWKLDFAGSAGAALEKLAASSYDVIITDMQMPGMNGAQLLREVQSRYPSVARIVLSGHTDQLLIASTIGTTHRYLSKPCDADLLVGALSQILALQDRIPDRKLAGLVAQIGTLPSLPAIYSELTVGLADGLFSQDDVGAILERDVAMTAKVLQVVNSAFFGQGRKVSSPVEASSILGVEALKAVVLSAHLLNNPDSRPPRRLRVLWQHSIEVAQTARRLAQQEGFSNAEADAAFTAGILHDVGTMILADNFPQSYESIDPDGTAREPDWRAEVDIFGASHAELGGYLLGLWGLPSSVVEAVALHHNPILCPAPARNALMLVHVAEALHSPEPDSALNLEYLEVLGLAERLPSWRLTAPTALAAS